MRIMKIKNILVWKKSIMDNNVMNSEKTIESKSRYLAMMYYWKYYRNTCVHKQTHNKGWKKNKQTVHKRLLWTNFLFQNWLAYI